MKTQTPKKPQRKEKNKYHIKTLYKYKKPKPYKTQGNKQLINKPTPRYTILIKHTGKQTHKTATLHPNSTQKKQNTQKDTNENNLKHAWPTGLAQNQKNKTSQESQHKTV